MYIVNLLISVSSSSRFEDGASSLVKEPVNYLSYFRRCFATKIKYEGNGRSTGDRPATAFPKVIFTIEAYAQVILPESGDKG
jgi:hypothetical protein